MRGPDTRRYLLRALAPSHATQPATLLWRIFEIEAILRGARLDGSGIDIGAGDGALAAIVFREMRTRPELIGVEPDAADADAARASGAYARVHQTSGDRIPEPPASADFVLSNSTLEHIDDVRPVLAEVARVLRPGGALVVTVPSEQFHSALGGDRLIEALARRVGRTYRERIDQRVAHRAYRGPGEWHDLLAAAGLDLERWERYFPLPAVRAWERLSNLTGGLLFELFGGRAHPRRIQRDLRMAGSVSPIVSEVVVRALEVMFDRALTAEVDEAEPSGGLLLSARRPVR